MKKYLGIKEVEGMPMNLGDYNTYKGWTIPEDEDPGKLGYLVKYPDGYVSWSPLTAFEDSHTEIEGDANTPHYYTSLINTLLIKTDSIVVVLPNSREKSLVKTKLDEAYLWLNSSR